MALIWEEPPPCKKPQKAKSPGRPASAWQEEAAQLRARSGSWARIGVKPTSHQAGNLAADIRSGRLGVFAPAGSFEAVARHVDGEYRVYARFVGGEA